MSHYTGICPGFWGTVILGKHEKKNAKKLEATEDQKQQKKRVFFGLAEDEFWHGKQEREGDESHNAKESMSLGSPARHPEKRPVLLNNYTLY